MTARASTHPANHWHQLQAEEVVRLLDVDLKTGLAGAEVKRRLEKFGSNVVRARCGTPAWLKFLQQFNQPLIMRTGLVTLIILLGGLGLFLWELEAEHAELPVARTVVVNLFVVVEALYLFNCRTLNRPFFTVG